MKIKICGITTKEEAKILNENKVDFAGMVMFFPKSKRNINTESAREIISVLDQNIKKVAVTVEPTEEQIKIIEKNGFDYIQIHGDIKEELIKKINIPILKAFNVRDMKNYDFYRNEEKIKGYVFDAFEPGSGKIFDWRLVREIPKDNKLLLLAGGLNPNNVTEAVKYLRPDGVDVSSGVENENGIGKSPEKIKMFVENARKADR